MLAPSLQTRSPLLWKTNEEGPVSVNLRIPSNTHVSCMCMYVCTCTCVFMCLYICAFVFCTCAYIWVCVWVSPHHKVCHCNQVDDNEKSKTHPPLATPQTHSIQIVLICFDVSRFEVPIETPLSSAPLSRFCNHRFLFGSLLCVLQDQDVSPAPLRCIHVESFGLTKIPLSLYNIVEYNSLCPWWTLSVTTCNVVNREIMISYCSSHTHQLSYKVKVHQQRWMVANWCLWCCCLSRQAQQVQPVPTLVQTLPFLASHFGKSAVN